VKLSRVEDTTWELEVSVGVWY